MKKFFIYAFAALMMGGFVASCSDDDPEIPELPEKPEPKPEPEPVVCPIADGTVFIDGKGLNLKYSDNALLGKQVKFVANASDATKATLVLSANAEAMTGVLPLPISGNSGVIPGEKTTSLNVNLVINGDKVSFEGKDELNGRVINFKGEGTKDALSLDLKVTMPENELVNQKFGLKEFKQKGNKIISSPLTLQWDSEAKLPILGYPQPVQAVLDLISTIGFPVEGSKETLKVAQLLAGVLNTITFLPDGNVQASFKDEPVGGEWTDSPLNLATYKVDAEKKIVTLYINVPQIIAFEKSQKKSRGEEESGADKVISELVKNALELVNQVLTEGIPVSYDVKDGVTSFYLDEKTVLPVLQMLNPVLENKEIMAMLMDMIKEQVGKMDPDLAAALPMIVEPILKAFPEVINKTKSMHFGLNLIPAEK